MIVLRTFNLFVVVFCLFLPKGGEKKTSVETSTAAMLFHYVLNCGSPCFGIVCIIKMV